jgi:hypothetical protein
LRDEAIKDRGGTEATKENFDEPTEVGRVKLPGGRGRKLVAVLDESTTNERAGNGSETALRLREPKDQSVEGWGLLVLPREAGCSRDESPKLTGEEWIFRRETP